MNPFTANAWPLCPFIYHIVYTCVCVCMASTRLAPRLLYVWSALHWSCAVATLRSPPPTRSRADKKKSLAPVRNEQSQSQSAGPMLEGVVTLYHVGGVIQQILL